MRERHVPAALSTPSMLSDAEVTALVDRHQRSLYAFLRGFAENGEQARDLVQDAFAAAWRATQAGAPPFVPGTAEDEVRRWLFHTAYCRAIDLLRRRRLIRWESLDTLAEPEMDGGLPPPFEERVIEGEALRAALKQLAPQDAACLLLRAVHGLSATEVGAIVRATPEVVTKRLSRAKQRLRAAYLAQNPVPSQERH